jgi:hypothetical protein
MSKKPLKTKFVVGVISSYDNGEEESELHSYTIFDTLALAKEYVEMEDAGPDESCKWVIYEAIPKIIEKSEKYKVQWVAAESR